ncbi:YHS domain-containing (seleno)protein [Fibrella sp. WM1]|uniref:YHS domain-containing (seleno)protein n=1 Tax=Fibrella musci TaxID=3242485 RepID=UPI00352101CC
MTRYIVQIALFTLFSLATALTALAQKPPVFAPDGKAIRGYDPVAYFTDSKPMPGDPAISYVHDGATWYFTSTQHRDAFKANPANYAPQYGGYCAFGASRGYKAPTEADAWTIADGKLYLNYNTKVRTEWNKDQAGYIKKADANWLTISSK